LKPEPMRAATAALSALGPGWNIAMRARKLTTVTLRAGDGQAPGTTLAGWYYQVACAGRIFGLRGPCKLQVQARVAQSPMRDGVSSGQLGLPARASCHSTLARPTARRAPRRLQVVLVL
jgi:hypothetical protein